MIYNKVVEVWRAPVIEDPYGKHRDWANAVRVAALPASVQPPSPKLTSEELLLDRETTIGRLRVFIRRTDVESTDRLLVDGDWWEVHGDPGDWNYPLPTRHMMLWVRRVQH